MNRLVLSLAAVAAVVGIGFASLASGYAAAESTSPPLGPGETATTWFLVGVSADRRQLLVAATSPSPTCRTARADLLSESATRLSLRVVFVSNGPEQPGTCEDTDDYVPPTVLAVKLDRRLAGQTIDGPDRVKTRAGLANQFLVLNAQSSGVRTFHVEGLGFADATANLRAWGFKKSQLRLVGPRSGYVTRLSPPLSREAKPRMTTVQIRKPPDGHARWALIPPCPGQADGRTRYGRRMSLSAS